MIRYPSILKMPERSLRLVGVVAPTPRRATSTNIQFAIFNIQFFASGLSGLSVTVQYTTHLAAILG